MRGGTPASRGPDAVRSGAGRRCAVRMILPVMASGDRAERPRSYLVRFHVRFHQWLFSRPFVLDTTVMAGGRAGLTGPRSWDVMTIISAYPPSRSLSSVPERT